MEVKTKKEFSKSIVFEKSGEAISIRIIIENPSPKTTNEIVINFAETMLRELKKDVIQVSQHL